MALDNTAEQELEAKKSKDKLGAAELMAHAQRKSGRGAFKIGREVMRLGSGINKLTLAEYVRYELYDSETYSDEDKQRFLGNSTHWPITSEVADRTWDAATEDKWLADTILKAGGQPVPDTVAVIDTGVRNYGATPKLGSADALRDFLTQTELPVFGKVLRGVASLGAFLVESADATHMHLGGIGPMTYEAFLADHVGENQYVVQKVVKNHSFFDAFTSHTATIRMCTFVRNDDVFIPFVVLKLPGGDNIADAFWRPGNVACNLDPATGAILNISTQTQLGLDRHEVHPETGAAMVGEHIPMWDQMLSVTKSAAHMFAPVRYQSLDVALTENGPVIIEINTGGGWDLIQNASATGFLTDEVRDTFRSWGSKLV